MRLYSKLLKMHVILLFCCHNHTKCTKCELCARVLKLLKGIIVLQMFIWGASSKAPSFIVAHTRFSVSGDNKALLYRSKNAGNLQISKRDTYLHQSLSPLRL